MHLVVKIYFNLKIKDTYQGTPKRKTNQNFAFNILEISLTQESNKLKGNITTIYNVNFLIKVNRKKYCSLIKTLNDIKKIHCIPPTYHNKKFISKTKAKCDL